VRALALLQRPVLGVQDMWATFIGQKVQRLRIMDVILITNVVLTQPPRYPQLARQMPPPLMVFV